MRGRVLPKSAHSWLKSWPIENSFTSKKLLTSCNIHSYERSWNIIEISGTITEISYIIERSWNMVKYHEISWKIIEISLKDHELSQKYHISLKDHELWWNIDRSHFNHPMNSACSPHQKLSHRGEDVARPVKQLGIGQSCRFTGADHSRNHGDFGWFSLGWTSHLVEHVEQNYVELCWTCLKIEKPSLKCVEVCWTMLKY